MQKIVSCFFVSAMACFVASAAIAGTSPTFSDRSLAQIASEYGVLKSEAPANNEYVLKAQLNPAQIFDAGALKAAVADTLSEGLCAQNVYQCPTTIETKLVSFNGYEPVAEAIAKALSAYRPDAEKSEHFFDLVTLLADHAEAGSVSNVVIGSESNPFGAAIFVAAVSESTGEVLFIGSGWAE